MYCNQCGESVPEGSTFCQSCGIRIGAVSATSGSLTTGPRAA
ncbi:MAG: zinc-ribbon domain-containing protein [Chloroflexi bacterium]|nr:zinc-ribbon domain-containing protein [Chloroflexota bacterium]